jgi:hypothetical protein
MFLLLFVTVVIVGTVVVNDTTVGSGSGAEVEGTTISLGERYGLKVIWRERKK